MTILVTGATGTIGRAVVAQLIEAGAPVRALTRDPAHTHLSAEAEIVGGDLTEPMTLSPALRGVDRMFLLALPQTAREVVARACDFQTCPVHEQDVAAVATRALLDDGHVGKAYTFTGPGKITLRDQVRAIASAIGENITFEEVTPEDALRIARQYGGRTQETAEVMLGFTALYSPPDNATSTTTATANRPALPTILEILGQPARTFQPGRTGVIGRTPLS